MSVSVVSEGEALDARAFRLGVQLDLRGFERARAPLGTAPLIWEAGRNGRLVLFRFGIAVCFGLDADEERAELATLREYASQPVDPQLVEDVDVVLQPGEPERVRPDGVVQLTAADDGRLAVVAGVLAKSGLLGHHEVAVSSAFDRVETLVEHLRAGTWERGSRSMLQQIGAALAVQVATVGRAEVGEKPDFLWNDAELHRLHEHLAHEFELLERDRALQRKLDLVANTAQTYVELQHARKALHLEWAIVLLIVFEIVIIVWDMWGGGGGH